MSLTNPNTPVSQQDLQDFYHKLLPYMGGSFGMIANKFNKGDMYSTDEKMIGQWIDGKPLYQLVVPYSFTGVTARTYVNVLDMTSYNIDTFVGAKGYIINSNSDVKTKPFPLSDQIAKINAVYDRTTKYLQLLTYEINNWTLSGHIIVQYTKTTDSAISIGSDTDYSTEEKIIGTWITGEPIYQKTISFTTPSNNSDSIVITKANISTNISTVVNLQGIIVRNGQVFLCPVYYSNGNDCCIYYDGSAGIYARANGIFTGLPAYVTIQYTKSTS